MPPLGTQEEPTALLGLNKKPQAQLHHTEQAISAEEGKRKKECLALHSCIRSSSLWLPGKQPHTKSLPMLFKCEPSVR